MISPKILVQQKIWKKKLWQTAHPGEIQLIQPLAFCGLDEKLSQITTQLLLRLPPNLRTLDTY